jgi:Domain of unknown function (DUF1905)
MIVDRRRDLAAPADLSQSPLSCHDGVMGSQRFRAVIAAGPRDSAVIMVPFDPDEAWGAKADHPVTGTIGGCRIRTRLVPAGRGWALPLASKRLISMGIAIGDEVGVELAPEGPQRGDLADDIAAALAANPGGGRIFRYAGAVFLAQGLPALD